MSACLILTSFAAVQEAADGTRQRREEEKCNWRQRQIQCQGDPHESEVARSAWVHGALTASSTCLTVLLSQDFSACRRSARDCNLRSSGCLLRSFWPCLPGSQPLCLLVCVPCVPAPLLRKGINQNLQFGCGVKVLFVWKRLCAVHRKPVSGQAVCQRVRHWTSQKRVMG